MLISLGLMFTVHPVSIKIMPLINEPVREKSNNSTRSDTNRAVQSKKQA